MEKNNNKIANLSKYQIRIWFTLVFFSESLINNYSYNNVYHVEKLWPHFSAKLKYIIYII